MSDQPDYSHLLKKIQAKYDAESEDTENYLEGLLYSNSITYWDYIHTDALLSLQIQRTTYPDEMVFIAYHQINELLFKMILWEIDQVAKNESLSAKFFEEKLMRDAPFTKSSDVPGGIINFSPFGITRFPLN